MTEEEWLACYNPQPMQELRELLGSHRKLRLFNCHCCRRVPEILQAVRHREILEVAEDFAEGIITPEEMASRRDRWFDFKYPFPLAGTWEWALDLTADPERAVGSTRLIAYSVARASGDQVKEQRIQAVMLRELFGNPFRSVVVAPSWLTSTVVALASQMYESRDFSAMPILADALQDAGCDCDDILNHLRDPNATHVRGCWALDLVLGKC
jgi:hypothetical protein